MISGLGNFSIDELIIHDVSANDGIVPIDKGVTLTEAPVPDLDSTRRNFFSERISRSLGSRAFSVVRDPNQSSKVPEHVAEILADSANLVPASQGIAKQLYVVQNKVNNAGLLTVIVGNVNGARCVSVLKLQRHRAMQMQLVDVPEKGKAFSAAILGDLTLTDDTRVFKASLFQADPPVATSVVGRISDEQRGYDPRTAVADFFLCKFLGCKLAKDPELETKAFYEGSRSYFNTLQDPEVRREYASALTALLRSPGETVRPSEFAEDFLKTEDRQAYLAHLAKHDVADVAFDKDVNLIKSKLRRPSLRTKSGISISGPADAMSDRVRQEDDENGSYIVIRDVLDELPA